MYVDSSAQARTLAQASIGAAQQAQIPLVLVPSVVHLADIVHVGEKKRSMVWCGAQNISAYADGPYTGEISAQQAHEAGASYVLIGHSERRQLFGETDALVAKKINNAWEAGLTPIVCVGELKKSTPARAAAYACAQLARSFVGSGMQNRPCFVAYEPVWAIGGHRDVDPTYAASVMKALRTCAKKERVRLRGMLYGGSVNTKTLDGFLSTGECDGFLIGSASVNPKEMASLCKVAARR